MASNSSRTTYGMVTSDGPVSNRNPGLLEGSQLAADWSAPARRRSPDDPRATSRAAEASPPRPAPTTTILVTAGGRASAAPDHVARTDRAVSTVRATTESGRKNASGQTRPPVRALTDAAGDSRGVPGHPALAAAHCRDGRHHVDRGHRAHDRGRAGRGAER